MTEKITYPDLEIPNYLNTRPVVANLNVTDLARACVLAPLNLLLVGDKGIGKTQLLRDIYNSLFNGNLQEGGHGIFIRAHPEVDIHNEIFMELDLSKAQRKLTENIRALIYGVDELNRAPPVGQNQFFGLGDGIFDYRGRSIQLGQDGYRILIGTANLGNGRFQGTFDTDEALYNRLHVVLDLDHEDFKSTLEDKFELRGRKADPNIKEAAKRDLARKIITASKEIEEATKDPGIEIIALVNYLEHGLDNCMKNNGSKGKIWPVSCQDCLFNKTGQALCSKIKSPVERTIEATVKYTAALNYLAKLKDPNIKIDATDLMFKAFELTGAYQFLLNPQNLKADHNNENPKFMAEVTAKLKEDFGKNKDLICTSLEEAIRDGTKVTRFFVYENQIGNYDTLTDKTKKKIQKSIEPYRDDREIGLGWVQGLIDFRIRKRK